MVKLIPWPGRTSKKAFTERFRAAFQEQFPDAVIEQGEELELRVVRPPRKDIQNVWLGRAYEEFCKTPANSDEILARWLRSLAALGSVTVDPECIIPVVKDHGWLESQRAGPHGDGDFNPWIEPYNSELLIVFAQYRDGLSFGHRSDFESLGIPFAELRERAFANLRRVIKEVSVTGRDGEYILGAGGTIDSSLLLLDEVTQDPRIQLAGSALVGISDRDSFWIADDANPYAVFGIAAKVARFNRSEPYPISRQLFYRQGERWVALDPEMEDAHHPIPNLNVIDIVGKRRDGGCDLVVIVASPLGTDARSIFRLCRKMDGYLQEINSQTWRQEHGTPAPGSTRIIVKLHPQSDSVVAGLLEAYGHWPTSLGAQLIVEELELEE